MTRFTALLAVLILTAVLASCGGGSSDAARTIKLKMSEYAFEPAALELKVGETVTIELENTGLLEHEVMFGHGLKKTQNRPDGYETDMFQAGGVTPKIEGNTEPTGTSEEHMEHSTGVMVTLPPGDDKAKITFNVTDGMVGEWEMGCFELGGVHYDSGMLGKVVVSK